MWRSIFVRRLTTYELFRFQDTKLINTSKEFQRLGVCGNFSDPYTTMTFAAEASIVNEMGKFLLKFA